MVVKFGSRPWGVVACIACLALANVATAQYSFTQSPFNSSSHSFYENIGVSWALQGKGWFANFGGPGPGNPPPFGGFDPNAQGNLGVGFRGQGFSGRFGLTAGQGSDSTFTSSSPSVTVPNGGMGFFSDVQQRPFVMGIIPIVGEGVSPVRWRLERMAEQGNSPGVGGSDADRPNESGGGSSATSSAEKGDLSVSAIKAQQAAEEEAKAGEIAELLAKARELEADGKLASAKIHYRRAALRATGKEQQEIAAKIRELEKK